MRKFINYLSNRLSNLYMSFPELISKRLVPFDVNLNGIEPNEIEILVNDEFITVRSKNFIHNFIKKLSTRKFSYIDTEHMKYHNGNLRLYVMY